LKKYFIFVSAMSNKPSYNPAILREEDDDVLTASGNSYSLVVWNDDVNTFEWVIETLIEVCSHTPEQAEQCALFIHTRGKYAVKNGSYHFLKPKCEAITDRQINATLEELA